MDRRFGPLGGPRFKASVIVYKIRRELIHKVHKFSKTSHLQNYIVHFHFKFRSFQSCKNRFCTRNSHTRSFLLHHNRNHLIVFGHNHKTLLKGSGVFCQWLIIKQKDVLALDRGPPNNPLASKMSPSEPTNATLSSAIKRIATSPCSAP